MKICSRSPRGNVDWNFKRGEVNLPTIIVVPHAGTWIEIGQLMPATCVMLVVPHAGTWIEIAAIPRIYRIQFRRSPRGNVDWNDSIEWCCKTGNSRSPRGNVDWNIRGTRTKNISEVVPHAGTWIEITVTESVTNELQVVPHAGTWIEIKRCW